MQIKSYIFDNKKIDQDIHDIKRIFSSKKQTTKNRL